MLVASVIVDVAARALDRAFDYSVPAEAGGIAVGCAVMVELRYRPVVGYVTDLREAPDDTEGLKPLLGVVSEPYFDAQSAQVAHWLSRECLAPLSECIKLFTPPGGSPRLKQVDGRWELVRSGVGPVDDRWVFPTDKATDFKPKANATKQLRVLDALSCGGMRVSELSLELGAVSSTLKALERRGVVTIETRRRIREAMPVSNRPDTDFAQLTKGQQEALDAISLSYERACPGSESVVVIDGITGSGKTEVYLRAISKVLEHGKTACVLVPEIALTPQTVGRFRARFGQQVAVLHSRLSAGERFDQWDLVRTGAAQVVVGTRSALFAPLGNLGLIIIDEEHEGSYKQDSSPRYVARNVALEISRRKGAVLVLGSATPSIETLANCQSEGGAPAKWTRVELGERPGGQPLPQVTVVDMGAEFGKGSRSMFSSQLVEALKETHEAGDKSVLLLNKRGFASFVLCRECGFVPECPECSVSLTYHEVGNALTCHHCGHSIPSMVKCPKCGSPYLRKFGAGTQRVEDELRAILPDVPIIRMDADTTKGKGAHEQLLEEFAASDAGILLGTQMIAKGLDFADVTLVGVINADTTLKLPDYRSPERTYQLLEQVSGRAGRADKPGRVVVQTYCPDHPAILAAASHDRGILLDEELPARQELGYPPYMRIANVLVWGKSESAVRQRATELCLGITTALTTAGKDWRVLGPSPCILSKTKGNYRWHILLKAPCGTDFSEVMSPLLAKYKADQQTRMAMDVDPLSLI